MAILRPKYCILTIWRHTNLSNIWINFVRSMLKSFKKGSHSYIPDFDSRIPRCWNDIFFIRSDSCWKYVSVVCITQFKYTFFRIIAPILDIVLMTSDKKAFCVWDMHIETFGFKLDISYIFLATYVPKSYQSIQRSCQNLFVCWHKLRGCYKICMSSEREFLLHGLFFFQLKHSQFVVSLTWN